MGVDIDLRKYFPNHILETRGEDIDFLYNSILKKIDDAKKELEYMQLYSFETNDCYSKLDNVNFTFNKCEEEEKFSLLLNFASTQIRELENVAFYLQQLKTGKLNKKIELGAIAG